jgi:hypothetical protein
VRVILGISFASWVAAGAALADHRLRPAALNSLKERRSRPDGQALELARGRGRVIDRLELLTEFAHALADTDPRLATRLLASADADYSRRSVVRPPPAARRHERLDAALAEALPEPVHARELDDGARLTLDEALAYEQIQAALTGRAEQAHAEP